MEPMGKPYKEYLLRVLGSGSRRFSYAFSALGLVDFVVAASLLYL